MNPEPRRFTADVGGRDFTIETGNLAGQAGGAVTVRVGESMVFCSATMAKEPREGISFFPLSVDYEERMYAAGRIPGGFFRREGRPTEEAILTCRLTDRPLRPLFPKDMRNDVQVIIYALSADGDTPLDIMAINAASAAVTISNAPWDGPVGAVRIGRINEEFIVNPSFEQMGESDLDLRLAGTREAILMVECGAKEIPEDVMVAALQAGHEAIQPIIDIQVEMRNELGKPKMMDYPRFAVADDLKADVANAFEAKINEALSQSYDPKADRDAAVKALQGEAVEAFADSDNEEAPSAGDVIGAFSASYKKVIRSRILEQGVRPDGRATDEVRPIWCQVDFSPRAHGSGIFTRGETQILTLTTLGTPRDAQQMDNLTPWDKKRYIHHYNFPPFSVGETRFLRGSSRREIGHGALAERALLPVIPEDTEFPYTLRLVSEALSSNGSTSMGSVCGSTLALMDAGVPIKAPVSGVAMGLVIEDDKYAILTDIQGVEDALGDMDFKVAGTDNGITALQMDIKISGLTTELMAEALEQARHGRKHIMNKMLDTISVPRAELKEHTPRISIVQISVEKIGAVIGPGGKTIRAIQEQTGARLDIEEDGRVFISTEDGESERSAREMVERLTEVAEIGRIYTGKVVRVTDFGAFVEVLPGQDGLVHISQLASERIDRVEDVASEGDELTVMITEVTGDGKIRLSRKAVLEGWTVEEAVANDRPTGGGRGGNRGGGRGGGDRNRLGGGNRR